MNPLHATALPITGDVALDAAHRTLYAELRRLADLPPDRFAAAYHTVVAALERDFREEEEVMEQMAFPGLACHREQHARALAGLHHAAAKLDEGSTPAARHAIRLLVEWLTVHIGTMDVALAAATSSVRRGQR